MCRCSITQIFKYINTPSSPLISHQCSPDQHFLPIDQLSSLPRIPHTLSSHKPILLNSIILPTIKMTGLKRLLLIAVLSTVFAFSNSSAIPEPETVRRDVVTGSNNLVARDGPICKYDGCTCHPEFPQGQYCGACGAVETFGGPVECSSSECTVLGISIFDTLFECGPNGSCCSYGYSQECHDTGYPC